jgi:hypothetical protein
VEDEETKQTTENSSQKRVSPAEYGRRESADTIQAKERQRAAL